MTALFNLKFLIHFLLPFPQLVLYCRNIKIIMIFVQKLLDRRNISSHFLESLHLVLLAPAIFAFNDNSSLLLLAGGARDFERGLSQKVFRPGHIFSCHLDLLRFFGQRHYLTNETQT